MSICPYGDKACAGQDEPWPCRRCEAMGPAEVPLTAVMSLPVRRDEDETENPFTDFPEEEK